MCWRKNLEVNFFMANLFFGYKHHCLMYWITLYREFFKKFKVRPILNRRCQSFLVTWWPKVLQKSFKCVFSFVYFLNLVCIGGFCLMYIIPSTYCTYISVLWIRIRIGSEALNVLFWELKASPLAWTWVNCNIWSKKILIYIFFSSVFGYQNPGSGSGLTWNAGSGFWFSVRIHSSAIFISILFGVGLHAGPVPDGGPAKPGPGLLLPDAHRLYFLFRRRRFGRRAPAAWRPVAAGGATPRRPLCGLVHPGRRPHLPYLAVVVLAAFRPRQRSGPQSGDSCFTP